MALMSDCRVGGAMSDKMLALLEWMRASRERLSAAWNVKK